MKKILFFAATAMLFAACTNDEGKAPEVAEAPQAVAFDTYVPNATRAGDAGIQTTTTLQAADKGFGVFAVHSDGSDGENGYAATQATDFMYNEHVTYDAPSWKYTFIKYWPNETKNDSQDAPAALANSNYIDYLSFFAYAPYVAVADVTKGTLSGVTYSTDPTAAASNVSSGEGIIALNTNNDTSNDPYVWYKTSAVPSNSVDLLWGVAPAGNLSYTSVAKNLTDSKYTASGVVTVPEGKPLVNLIKPSKDQKIKFLFKHALARLGVTVVAAVDQIAPGGDLASQTKVAVESIKITDVSATKVLYTEGRLNLNNETKDVAKWDVANTPISELTIDATHELNKAILWKTNAATTVNETPFEGVDKTEKSAMTVEGDKNADYTYFMLIPYNSPANTDLKVEITYYVITYDPKLTGSYSVVKNQIEKQISISALTNNKAYNLKLILGLTSVKLDAEVADWEINASTEVNLPKNNE